MAFGSVSDILLRITGDQSDAADAIAELAGELAVFSKQSAEAEADVLTDKAQEKLRELRARLDALDLAEAEPEVRAKVAQAMVELQLIEGQMNDIDGRELEVDVDVRRGALERLNAASNSVLGLTKRVRGLGGASEGLFSNLSDVGLIVGPFAARIGTIAQVVAILSPLIVALGGALVALASSLGAAALGLGALGVAAGGVFAAGLGFAFAAVARFKDQADTAGTPANALKTAFESIGNAAKALLPAVDPVFTALASGLNAIKPLIDLLVPGFKAFGQAAADAVGALAGILASPEIGFGISNLLRLAGPVLTPLAEIAGQVFRIFLNIAQAAMPALSRGAQAVADALQGIGDSTSDIGGLRGSINGLVGVLGQWLDLLGAIGEALFGIFSASAGPGTQLVGFLTDGANALSDWVNSAEGQDRIKQFFEDTLPLVRQLAEFAARLVVVFIQIGEVLAPVLEPVVAIMNILLGVISGVLEAFLSLPAPVRNAILGIVAIIVALLTGVGEVTAAVLIVVGVIAILKAAFDALGGVASAAFGVVKSAASTAWGVIRAIVARPLDFVARILSAGPIGQARNLWNAVKTIITGVINFALKVLRDPLGAARSLWSGVKGVISAAINFVMRVPRDPIGAARSVWSGVKSVIVAGINFVLHLPAVGGLISAAKSIWDAINSALPDIDIGIHIDKPNIPVVGSPVHWYGSWTDAGKAMAEKLSSGLNGAFSGLQVPVFDTIKAQQALNVSGAVAALPGDSLAPSALPPAVGKQTTINNTIEAPAGELPDAESTVALIAMKQRARGDWD